MQIHIKVFLYEQTGHDGDDDENCCLDANLCKSVSIGTAGRFIPTSGGANSQKNIYQYLLSLFLFPRITWERCENEDKTTIMFLGQNILGAIAFRLRNMNMYIFKVVANF